jgi:hypothetical protein
MNYWKECISEAFDDAGITASEKQIETVVDWVKGAHENYGMAFGHDCIPNPLESENKRLTQELKVEKNKITCPACNGHGSITSNGPYHSSHSSCFKCRGEGRV